MLVGLTVIGGLVAVIPFAVWYAATGADLQDSLTTLLDLKHPTPAGLAYLNVALASMIPLTWLVTRVAARARCRAGWPRCGRGSAGGSSLACLGVAVVALVATLLVGVRRTRAVGRRRQRPRTPSPRPHATTCS